MKAKKKEKPKKNISAKKSISKARHASQGAVFDRKKNKLESASQSKKTTVSKIYRKNKELDRRHFELIARLASKKESASVSGATGLKMNNFKKLPVKKVAAIFLFIIFISGVFAGGYYSGLKKRSGEKFSGLEKRKADEKETIEEKAESVKQEEEERVSDGLALEETADSEGADAVEVVEMENLPIIFIAEEIYRNEPEEEQPVITDSENEEKIQPDKIALKVLNKGAEAGSAKEVKNLLAGKGYAEIETKDGRGSDVVENTVFFKEEKFIREAQLIREILLNEGGIFSYARQAGTDEEKSADIVIVLGTLKEAPPN